MKARPGFPVDLAVYVAGFVLTAVMSFFLLAIWVGRPVASVLGSGMRLSLLTGVVVVLLVVDLRRSRRGELCSLGLRRQTPRHLGFVPYGTFLWGLDTGIPITTYRTTPLPVIGITLVALGFGTPWIGVSYTAGFLGALLLSCVWPKSQRMRERERHDPRLQGPLQIVNALEARIPLVRAVSLLYCGGLVLLLAVQVLDL